MYCRFLSLILAAGLMLSSGKTVMAAEKTEEKSTATIYEAVENLSSDELVSFLYDLSAANDREDTTYDHYYVDCWNELKQNKKVYVDLEGHFVLDDTVADQYAKLAEVMESWNLAIELGILAVDYETMFLYTPEITGDVLDNITSSIMALNENVVPYASAHGCGLDEWDVGAMAAENYKTIKDYYLAMTIASAIAGPGGVNAHLSTTIYWVGYVREGGAWDYKSNPSYANKNFCCKYGGNSNQDQHVSWVGNYNYGYTGKVLFDLTTLHLGSSAVAGFDPKDKVEDWPAIDEGYYDAP